MLKFIAVAILATGLASCDAIDSVKQGFSHAYDVETELEQSTGQRPAVGFSWNNGNLTSVTVTFPSLYDAKPPRELSDIVRASVAKHFKQDPDAIVLGFTLRKVSKGA